MASSRTVPKAVLRWIRGKGYIFHNRGVIDVKGKGPMQVYLLKGKKSAVPQSAGV